MNCNDVQQALLETDGGVVTAVAEHLAGCPACQEVVRLSELLQAADLGPAPSPALDRTVGALARRRLGRRRWRVWASPWRRALAAAAAVVIAAWFGSTPWRGSRPLRPEVAATVSAVAAAPHLWDQAHLELEAIDGGLSAALAELETISPSFGTAAGVDPWDALMELEFDVYFESQDLLPTDG